MKRLMLALAVLVAAASTAHGATLWKVEVLDGVGTDRRYRSWEMSAVTDINNRPFNIPSNPKIFTIDEISQWIEQSQNRIEGETAYKALLAQIKAAAEALP